MAALSLAATGVADPGKENKAKKHGKYTFNVTTTDNGSCGQPWATDVVRRTFQVKKNKDGSYTLTRRDRGAFTTIGGPSPGSCDTTGKHGTTVVAGVKGKLVGYIRGTVTGGTFKPNATCTGLDCGFTDVFITTFFGSGAQFSCFTNSEDCKFNFNYTASAKSNPPLRYRHWQDKGKGAGTMLKEEFSGDIATA
ncbi:MAG: hypothetical protein ABI717_05505 [Actinomycetota bacterium]